MLEEGWSIAAASREAGVSRQTGSMWVAWAREMGKKGSGSSPGATGTDANAMQVSRAGMATGLIGLPLRYMHTPVELCSLKDVEDTARLMAAYCRQVTPETDFTPGS